MVRSYTIKGIEDSTTGEGLGIGSLFEYLSYTNETGQTIMLGQGMVEDITDKTVTLEIVKATDGDGEITETENVEILLGSIIDWYNPDMPYKIFPIISNDEETYDCTHLVILCRCNSPFEHIDNIRKDLGRVKHGSILIDQLLHAGNRNCRFLSVNDKGLMDFVHVPKKSFIRRKSQEFLLDSGLINDSTLTSIQQRMMQKGIII